MKYSQSLIAALLLAAALTYGCGSSQGVSAGRSQDTQVTNENGIAQASSNQSFIGLDDYLRRIPGLYVTGRGNSVSVRVRAMSNSIIGDSDPLFVLDGVAIGTDFNQIAQVINVNDIANITVLKNASETTIYGVRGANGVIVIKSKTN
ncbi:MAG: TonB-dependent receptor plug domain-containing protein [Lewinellaceae bacterium]|nr:TonB-dependent receptor plug domain-containing protein [Lewinellaceae bacterium]